MKICNGSIRNQFLLSVLHNNFHLLEHFTNPSVELQWLLLHSAPDKLHYLNAIDPIVATSAEMLFPGAEWHPQFAGQNISNISFEIEFDITDISLLTPVRG